MGRGEEEPSTPSEWAPNRVSENVSTSCSAGAGGGLGWTSVLSLLPRLPSPTPTPAPHHFLAVPCPLAWPHSTFLSPPEACRATVPEVHDALGAGGLFRCHGGDHACSAPPPQPLPVLALCPAPG